MCRVLGVSRSGFYAWLQRPPSQRARRDAELSRRIQEIHAESRGTYGSPRIHAELVQGDQEHVSRKRVARLMRDQDLEGVTRRRRRRTTIRDDSSQPAPDLLQRDFSALGPNRVWVADITYIPTDRGFLYLAVVLDAWSRRVVGWHMARHLKTEIVLSALSMALAQRRHCQGVIHHSDHGCQYTSIAFGRRCERAGIRPSMGSVGDCYDNAMCESFFATLECELLDRHRFEDPAAAERMVFSYLEGWYNPRRRHSALSYLSPAAFECQHVRTSESEASQQLTAAA